MSKLLQEAIADANKVKEIAYENAKAAIEEAFQPQMQRMISAKIAEEEGEEEMPPVPDEEQLDVPPADPTAAPVDNDPVDDVPPIEDEFMDEEKYIDDGDDGTPANNLEEEFDAILKELEADQLEEKDDAYDKEAPKSKKDIVKEMDDDMAADVATSDEDDLEDLELEALIRKLEEEEFGNSPATDSASNADSGRIAELTAQVKKLKAENREAYKVIAKLKEAINEVNLLNSKLQFSSKVIKEFDLTESQQFKVLETFDRANSLREVKLIYTTISENYKGKPKKKIVRRKPQRVTESASRTIRTVKGKPAHGTKKLMEGAERWQVIAGLKPLND